MDIVLCEAPLDNSFQKEKLELVNKGSLGRRRKPSRANLKLLLSPSSNNYSPTSVQTSSQKTTTKLKSRSEPSTPVYVEQKIIVNGSKDHNSVRCCKIGLKTESSLPRTKAETNQYLNEAQQFTIEAKLKRRKSDSGRSAVLIQTWERRTRCDSFSKQARPKIIARTNRFQNKENMGGSTILPNSHPVYPKYNGNTIDNESSKDVGFIANVRDHFSNGTMHSSNFTNGFCHEKMPHMHSNHHQTSEPEWISISRKLRAKFVEGHIEPNPTDSYVIEEPERVKSPQVQKQSIKINPQSEKHAIEQPKKVEKKIKVVVDTTQTISSNGEPPWVQLSRKLCTKFIEEHIEYPIISNNIPIRDVREVLEGKGDVRIIEKIGKPKDRKSKTRKESEPEWVSLSKKLRAKFIESHIDDPDTISLENQLNASDPDETSLESVSDTSPEVSLPKRVFEEFKQYKNNCNIEKNLNGVNNTTKISQARWLSNELTFPEKECCWEYQEMEFDQESNSGTFLDPDLPENDFVEGNDNRSQQANNKNSFNSNVPQSQIISVSHDFSNGLSFVETINQEPFHNAECYNNDVRFPPHMNNLHESHNGNADYEKKYITVQFIAHSDKNVRNSSEFQNKSQNSSPSNSPVSNNCDFFNISTWEEAHYKSEDADSERNPCPDHNNSVSIKIKSKSVNDLCKTSDDDFSIETSSESAKRQSDAKNSELLLSKSNSISKSESVLDKIEAESFSENFFNDLNNRNNYTIPDNNNDQKVKEILNENMQLECSSSHDCYDNSVIEAQKKQFKCNGVIPNSRNNFKEANSYNESNISTSTTKTEESDRFPDGFQNNKTKKVLESISVNEYANICPLVVQNTSSETNTSNDLRNKSMSSLCIYEQSNVECVASANNSNGNHSYSLVKKKSDKSNKKSQKLVDKSLDISCDKSDTNENRSQLRAKSTSLCDISRHKDLASNGSCVKQEANGISQYSLLNSKTESEVKFQHFASEADIPLCAKLVKQNGKCSTSSISSSYRNTSPCSESSHVYEDMFKETTSCPSDSETSSWTVLKNNNTYYINGRSSSMNDLDCSDSCSMSVKCDYASSCSEQSTLQSRNSSCTSSSFYVNLRDYDSHMLEPSLNRKKDHIRKVNNGNPSKLTISNPPTPESLRHLFTSPFNSNPHRGNKFMNKLPSEPDIHYYSSTSAASTAFKHGFDPSPQKQKKTERSSSIKIKDIAHGIILTFRKFQNHSKNSHVSSTHYVDVSHLAESSMKPNKSEVSKSKSKKDHKDKVNKRDRKGFWGFPFENGKTDSDSGCHLSASEMSASKARRSSSDLTGIKPKIQSLGQTGLVESLVISEKKKIKNIKKNSSAREKGKKTRSKSVEPKTIPTVSRKVQQLADGTFYLVTTVSGDTSLPGVYSDSPDTSSELSSHKPVKPSGESNC